MSGHVFFFFIRGIFRPGVLVGPTIRVDEEQSTEDNMALQQHVAHLKHFLLSVWTVNIDRRCPDCNSVRCVFVLVACVCAGRTGHSLSRSVHAERETDKLGLH